MFDIFDFYERLGSLRRFFALEHHGRAGFADSPTAEELALSSEFSAALAAPLLTAYTLPLDTDLSDLMTQGRQALEDEFMRLFRDTPSLSADLMAVLLLFAIRSFELGGNVALTQLRLQGRFSLQDPDILTDLDAVVQTLSDVDGEMSLLRTTARELARKIDEEQANGQDWFEMRLALLSFARLRVFMRSMRIAENELVRMSRRGLASTFFGNGVTGVFHRLNRDNGRSYPPCRCPQLNGMRFSIRSVRDPFGDISADDRIPVHMWCHCYYDPDTEGWVMPALIWTGFVLSEL